MKRHARGPIWPSVLSTTAVALFALCFLTFPEAVAASPGKPDAGSLTIIGKDGALQAMCPLKHTDVRATVSGFLARVIVTQIFENDAKAPIEAVYTFPLPQDAAVDDMTIHIGDRTVKGVIKRDGFSVEKILFESRPGFFVTAAMFLPDAAKFPPPWPRTT